MHKPRDWFGDQEVYVYDLPLACCALESQASPVLPEEHEVPDDAKLVLTLSGTITHAVVPAIRHAMAALPRRPIVVAFGACACVGGPYWDSYAVAKGAGDLGMEVDHFVPGCPPPPEALDAVLEAIRRG